MAKEKKLVFGQMFGLAERMEKLPAYLHVLLNRMIMEEGGNNQPKNNKSAQHERSAYVSWIY